MEEKHSWRLIECSMNECPIFPEINTYIVVSTINVIMFSLTLPACCPGKFDDCAETKVIVGSAV